MKYIVKEKSSKGLYAQDLGWWARSAWDAKRFKTRKEAEKFIEKTKELYTDIENADDGEFEILGAEK